MENEWLTNAPLPEAIAEVPVVFQEFVLRTGTARRKRDDHTRIGLVASR
jgi:hypothetical protein